MRPADWRARRKPVPGQQEQPSGSTAMVQPRRARLEFSLDSLAGVMLTIGAFASSWNGVHVGGLQIVDLMLMAALGLLVLSALSRLVVWPSSVPSWIWMGVAAILICTVGRIWWPMTQAYMTQRTDLQGMHGEARPSAAMEGVQWLVAVLVLPACTAAVATREVRWCIRIAVAWASGVAMSCLVAVTDQAGITQISASLIGDGVDYSGRQAGLCSHANSLGLAAVLAFAVGTWYAQRRPVRGTVLQMVLLVGIVLSGSRGAQAMLLLVCIALAVGTPRARAALTRFFALALVASPFALAAMGGVQKLMGTLLRFGSDSGNAGDSNAERGQVAVQGLHDFALHPWLGVGLDQITYAHNIYLQMLSSGGLVLLLGMGGYFAFAIMTAVKLRTRSDFAFVLALVMCAWLVLGMVENSLVDRFLYVPIGLTAGLWSYFDGLSRRGLKASVPAVLRH